MRQQAELSWKFYSDGMKKKEEEEEEAKGGVRFELERKNWELKKVGQ